MMLGVKSEQEKKRLELDLMFYAPSFLYDKARENWGERTQLVVAVEEMSELTKELCKYLRDGVLDDSLAEEVADVQIMLEQVERFYNIEEKVRRVRREKLERLSRRLIDSIIVEDGSV